MIDFKTMYDLLYKTVVADPILRELINEVAEEPEESTFGDNLRDSIDEDIIDEVTRLASEDEDGENEDDMYLTRIGYLEEDKPKPKSDPWWTPIITNPCAEVGGVGLRTTIASPAFTGTPTGRSNIVDNELYALRGFSAISAGAEPPDYRRRDRTARQAYHDEDWGNGEWNTNLQEIARYRPRYEARVDADGISRRYFVDEQQSAELDERDLDFVLRRLSEEVYNPSYLRIDEDILRGFLEHARSEGLIDRFRIIQELLRDEFVVVAEKGQFRKNLAISRCDMRR